MELKKFSSELQELTFEQASGINGGESLWYWIAYGVGATVHFIGDLLVDAHNNPIRPSEYR
jgi:hypothetical protein